MNSRVMKLAMVGVIAVIAAGSMAFVQSGKGSTQGGRTGERIEGSHCGGGKAGKMLRHLDLSDEQKARIEAIRASFKTENAATLERISTIHSSMREARSAGDDAGATTLRQEMREAKESLRPAQARMDEQIRAVLTPEQIARLDRKKGRRGCRGDRGTKQEQTVTPRTQPSIPGIQ